jgi:hypothetical protein
VTYNVSGFPANTPLAITWRRLSGSTIDIATAQTNGAGAASGRFRVPATPGGPNQQIIFKAGSVSKTVLFEVAPRIKVNTDPAIRGQVADVSLRGYDKKETVRIRWLNGNTWVQVATVVTSNTGSANVDVVVPAWAPTGLNSVRGDGTVNRQQTNVVNVEGDVSAATPGASVTASVTATATATETMTAEPAETAVTETATATEVITETVTAEPTVTETATEIPTETEVPTEIPTEEPPPVDTVVATETESP